MPCSPSSRRCERPDYAERNVAAVRSTDGGSAPATCPARTTRHSSAGGVVLQTERRRSASLAGRRSGVTTGASRLAHRRTAAVELEGRHRAGSARCSLILLPPNHRRRGLHRMQTEFFRPAVVQTLGNRLAPAQLGDTGLAVQARQHDPDLLLSSILLACAAPDVLDKRLGRVLRRHAVLSHLRSLRSLRWTRHPLLRQPLNPSLRC